MLGGYWQCTGGTRPAGDELPCLLLKLSSAPLAVTDHVTEVSTTPLHVITPSRQRVLSSRCMDKILACDSLIHCNHTGGLNSC
jgi:hypothetical protein